MIYPELQVALFIIIEGLEVVYEVSDVVRLVSNCFYLRTGQPAQRKSPDGSSTSRRAVGRMAN